MPTEKTPSIHYIKVRKPNGTYHVVEHKLNPETGGFKKRTLRKGLNNSEASDIIYKLERKIIKK